MNADDIKKIKKAEANDVVTRDGVTLFWGGWPSQWYPSEFTLDGHDFNCAEQYMMWSKAKFLGDEETARKILKVKWPKAQKELGRNAKPWNPAWDKPSGSRAVVLKGTLAKFGQNADLRKKLLATGDTVIGEASPYDTIWGIGFDVDHKDAWAPKRWTGTNWLGKVLMKARETL
ncbi:MAG: NADAR family protein [Polyangiaceae bacterium]